MELFLILLFALFILPQTASANCPVCILTVGGGLFLAEKLGIDNLLVSIWLSGLNTAIAFWLASKVKNKYLNNPFLWSVGFYMMTIIYLVFSKQIGGPKNIFMGIDKTLFGMTVGIIVFLISYLIDQLIRHKNNNKVLFPYQKVIIPFVLLLIATIGFKMML